MTHRGRCRNEYSTFKVAFKVVFLYAIKRRETNRVSDHKCSSFTFFYESNEQAAQASGHRRPWIFAASLFEGPQGTKSLQRGNLIIIILLFRSSTRDALIKLRATTQSDCPPRHSNPRSLICKARACTTTPRRQFITA